MGSGTNPPKFSGSALLVAEKYDPVVPAGQAPVATIDQGTQQVFGFSRPGPIRALP